MICTFCFRPLNSLVVHNGRPRVLVETFVRDGDETVPCCQICEVQRDPGARLMAADLERDAAARLRAAWRVANPRRKTRRPGRPAKPDAYGPLALPVAE